MNDKKLNIPGLESIKETIQLIQSQQDYALEITRYVTYKNLWEWRKQNLMLEESIIDGARSTAGKDKVLSKTNLHGYFWIRIVASLKGFGMRSTKVLKVKEQVLEKVDNKQLLEGLSPNEIAEQVERIERLSDDEKQQLKELILSGSFKEDFDKVKIDYLYLMIYRVIYLRHDIKLVVNNNGDAFFYDPYLAGLPMNEAIGNRPCIILTLRHYLIDVLTESRLIQYVGQYNWITEKESKILEILRDNEVKYVRIKYKNGSPHKIMLDREGKIRANQKLATYLLNGGYEEILVKATNGKVRYSVRTEKIIFED